VRWQPAGRELRFVLWPHEFVSSDARGRFVESGDVVERRESAGASSWGVAARELPEVALGVRLEPHGDELRIRYALENLASEPRFVAIAPCLQLPRGWLGAAGWPRAKRVFVVGLDGLRWIADTAQRRGRAMRGGDPDPSRSPWSQHFLARSPAGTLLDSPLALFGIAAAPVAASWIGASAPGGQLHVLAASSADSGATYSLLDCLHAGVGARLGPHERRHLELRLYFHAGGLAPLVARAARELGERRPAPAPDFVPPDALERRLASFEAGAEGWSAGESGADASPWFAPTHGARRLRATLAPGVPLSSPWLEARGEPGRAAWLALDVASPTAAGARLALELESRSGPTLASRVALAEGKWRRVVMPLPEGAHGPLRLRVRADDAREPFELAVDDVTLFTR